MDSHLGYKSNDHDEKNSENRRNGYTHKTLKSSMGDIEITSPRDRNASFTPQIIQKPSTDVIRDLEDKVLAMYVRGISQMDIACTIEDIYGFNISSETISAITYPNDKSFLKALYLQIIELYKNEIVAR